MAALQAERNHNITRAALLLPSMAEDVPSRDSLRDVRHGLAIQVLLFIFKRGHGHAFPVEHLGSQRPGRTQQNSSEHVLSKNRCRLN